MRYLALDIGRKHTGVAYADAALKVPVPLETIHHDTVEELVNEVTLLVAERSIDAIIVGLPLLSHGKAGMQATFTRDVAEQLQKVCSYCTVHLLDERFSDESVQGVRSNDPHALAALNILRVFMERERGRGHPRGH